MHTSKLFACRAKAHKQPCALIFADLVKAFDRVLRGVVLGDSSVGSGPADGDQAGKRWQECGAPDSVVSDALAYMWCPQRGRPTSWSPALVA